MASSARLDELKKKFEENPRRYFAPLANELRKSGELDQAITLCRTHLPQQPAHISGNIVLAQALFEAGSLDESRDIFHTALGFDPENLIALRYLGDIARESADIETARSWYQRVLEVDPRNEEIVQLVRNLDAPPAAQLEVTEELTESTEARFAPPAPPAPEPVAETAPAPEPVAPVAPNDRFAPLDEVDLQDGFSTAEPNAPAAPNDSAAEPEVHASWTVPAGEGELLDTSAVDPFDFDPNATVDSLYAADRAEPEQDFFLTELSAAPAEPEVAEAAGAATTPDTWDAAAPTEGAPAPPSSEELEAFEEGDFYLEPAPEHELTASAHADSVSSTEPVAEVDAPTPHASMSVDLSGEDAFAAEYAVPADEPEETKARATGSQQAVREPTPNADAMPTLAEMPTAEMPTADWQPPVEEMTPSTTTASDIASTDDLGLEVMEFVPPSRETPQTPAQTPEAPADPMYGHTMAAESTEPSPTPDAFVTETMAELYLQQGFRNEALGVYRELLARNPSDTSLRDRIDQIEAGSISSIGMASVSEDVVESAIKRQQTRPGRSVRSFFASLAGRRAPAAASYDATSAYGEPSVDQYATEPSASAPESVELETPHVPSMPASPEPEPVAEPNPATESSRIAPLISAAETLASFDPFADVSEPTASLDLPAEREPNATPAMGEWPMARTPTAPSEPIAQALPSATPAPAATTPSRPTPLATPALTPASALNTGEAPSARRSLEDLFPNTPVASRTEAAAETLATAFGRGEPQGRPTRAASNELSLDHVFRGAPEGAAPAGDGGFSFDQFFSDSRSSTGEVAAPAATAPESAESGSSDAHDIEQFTAWLEGLKKK